MSGILGLGSEGSQGLNQEMIDKLKEKETEAKVDPYQRTLDKIEKEAEVINEIEAKTFELLETIKPFDLYVSGGITAFNQVSATTTGTSVQFDAIDTSGLSEGTMSVDIKQLATKDVYQSDKFTGSSSNIMASGQGVSDKLSITVDGQTFNFETAGLSYDELAEAISLKSNNTLSASVEYVSDTDFRLVIKATETGLQNSLAITQSTGLNLGYEKIENHTLYAQNMKATIDGIDYDVSSNTINTQGGLTITGLSLGESTITIKNDLTTVTDSMMLFTQQYNDLVELVNTAVYEADSPVENISSLKMMMDEMKNIMFGSYGLNDEESLFNYGFSFDSNGYMILDTTKFAQELNDNPVDLEELFIGYAEKEGLGTKLKTFVDGLDGFDGLLFMHEENMVKRKKTAEEEKEKATKSLDEKYFFMEQQFAATTALITQMEAEFAGLKSMIESNTN